MIRRNNCGETWRDLLVAILTAFRQFAHALGQLTWESTGPSLIYILVGIGLAPHLAFTQPEHFALVVTGASGNNEFHDKFSKWSTQLIEILQKDLLYPRGHIYFLTEEPGLDSSLPNLKATKAQLARTFDELGTRVKKDDLLFIVLLGHASFDGGEYKLNLVGPDVTGSELKAWLERFRGQTLAIVAATPCSGVLSRQLSLGNRMLITATKSEFENNNLIFPEFLNEALKERNADRDKNSHVSFLEAFLFSSQKTAAWYQDQRLLATEHPTLEDTGSQSPASETSLSNGEGLHAATCFLDYPIAGVPSLSTAAGASPELDSLYQRKRDTEELIQQLKNKKAALNESEYSKQLEALLIQLARTAQKIKDAEKKQ